MKRQEATKNDRIETGGRQESDREGTAERQGSDPRATGKQQAGNRGATGGKKCQESDREATGGQQDGNERARRPESIGTTAQKSFGTRYGMPCPALEAALHAQLIIWYIVVPFGRPFSFACADHMYTPVGGKAPPVLLGAPRCSPWEPRGAVPARWCGARAYVRRPVAMARPAWCRARHVLCRALPRGPDGVCVSASVRLLEVRVPWLRGGSPGPLSWSLPQVFCDLVLWCSMPLNPLPWDMTGTRVLCPDAGTPDFLGGHACRRFSGLVCYGVGASRTTGRAGLRVTFPCSPEGAGGLVGLVR